jgi:hypothetical protein
VSTFASEKYVDIYLIYEYCNRNASAAIRAAVKRKANHNTQND